MRFLRACLVGLALAGPASAADPPPPVQENVREYESRPQSHQLPEPAGAVPAQSVAEPGPAEDPGRPSQAQEDALWSLLEAGRTDELDAEIARIKTAWPEWDPPPSLVQRAGARRIRAAIASARARGDDAAVVALAEAHPDFFGCQDLGNAWALAEARGRRQGAGSAARTYRALLASCADPAARIANLEKLRAIEAPGPFLAHVTRIAAADPALAASPEWAALDLDARRRLAAEAADAGDFAAAAAALEPAEARILSARDAAAGALLAWSYERLGRAQEALAWEERLATWGEDRGLALARARLAAGDEPGALAAAESLADRDPEAAAMAAGLRLARASLETDCRTTLEELEAAQRLGALDLAALRLRAWALHDCGRDAEAGDQFATLYARTSADPDARGLVIADWGSRRLERTVALARDRAGPLQDRLPSGTLPLRDGAVAYDRLTLTRDGRVEILRRSGWAAWAGAGHESRRGEGPGRLDTWRAPLARVSVLRDADEWTLDLDRIDLEAEPARAGDWPLAVAESHLPRMSTGADGLEGRLGWRRDRIYSGGAVDLEASVGITPTGQDISPTWTGRLAAARADAASGWTAALERDGVRQSLTSWVGTGAEFVLAGTPIRLPFHWGRVTRTGLALSGYRDLGGPWQAAGSVRAGLYSGQNVPDNTGLEFYGTLLRALADTGPWRISAGPWLYVSAFRDNLGRFSPGHGGYFSPAWLGQGGLSVRAAGAVADTPWYLDARVDLGWQRHEEEAAGLIPHDGLRRRFLDATGLTEADLGRFEPRTVAGFAGGLELEGMRRLGRSAWSAGGRLGVRFAPQYDETTAVLVVRYGSPAAGTTLRDPFRALLRDRF